METKNMVILGAIEGGAKLVQNSFEELKVSGGENSAKRVAKVMARKLTTPIIERAIKNKVDSLEILEAIHKGTEAGTHKLKDFRGI